MVVPVFTALGGARPASSSTLFLRGSARASRRSVSSRPPPSQPRRSARRLERATSLRHRSKVNPPSPTVEGGDGRRQILAAASSTPQGPIQEAGGGGASRRPGRAKEATMRFAKGDPDPPGRAGKAGPSQGAARSEPLEAGERGKAGKQRAKEPRSQGKGREESDGDGDGRRHTRARVAVSRWTEAAAAAAMAELRGGRASAGGGGEGDDFAWPALHSFPPFYTYVAAPRCGGAPQDSAQRRDGAGCSRTRRRGRSSWTPGAT